MPIPDQPSDFPTSALRMHQSISSPAPSHFSRVPDSQSPDTSQFQVMSPNPAEAPFNVPMVPPFPAYLRRVEMSEVTVPAELLQQQLWQPEVAIPCKLMTGWKSARQSARLPQRFCGRTEILAGALQSVATSTQGLSDRIANLEQQLTESSQREFMMADRLTRLEKFHSEQIASLEGTIKQMGEAMTSMQQALAALRSSVEQSNQSVSDIAVNAMKAKEQADRAAVGQTDAGLRVRMLEDQHQILLDQLNQMSQRGFHQQPVDVQIEQEQQGGDVTPVQKHAPVHFALTPSPDKRHEYEEGSWWNADQSEAQQPPGLPVPTSKPGFPSLNTMYFVDDGIDYRRDSVWKILKVVPKLEFESGESWERALQLSVWKAELLAILMLLVDVGPFSSKNVLSKQRVCMSNGRCEGFQL